MSDQATFIETPDRSFGYSLFPKGATDNHPKARQTSWEALEQHFERTWTPCDVHPGDDPKKGLPGFSMATFRPRTTRARQNVLHLDGLMIDFDNSSEKETGEYHLGRDGRPSNRPKTCKVCLPDPVYPEAVAAVLAERQVAGALYTTWSHRSEWPRFRMAVGFANPVPADLWPAATEYALDALGLRPFLRGIDLPVMRDTARMHFLPGSPEPSSIQRWRIKGKHLVVPVDALQSIEIPEPPRPAWQEGILREQAATESTWHQRFQVKNRPVDFRTLDLVRLLRAMGVKVGRPQGYGGGTKWRTHCPWASEHSHGLDDDSAVVIHIPGHWPIWRCAHSHHAHLGLRDLLEAFGGVL
jgi:hypothetical protein